jgi:hypothetical protein
LVGKIGPPGRVRELESAMDRCGPANEINRSKAIRRLVEIGLKTVPARAKR